MYSRADASNERYSTSAVEAVAPDHSLYSQETALLAYEYAYLVAHFLSTFHPAQHELVKPAGHSSSAAQLLKIIPIDLVVAVYKNAV